jgi:cell division transport system permease protein
VRELLFRLRKKWKINVFFVFSVASVMVGVHLLLFLLFAWRGHLVSLQEKYFLSAFIEPDLNPAIVQKIDSELKRLSAIRKVEYISEENLKARSDHRMDKMISYLEKDTQFSLWPTYFRIYPKEHSRASEIDQISTKASALRGIDYVEFDSEKHTRLYATIQWLQWTFFLGLMGVLTFLFLTYYLTTRLRYLEEQGTIQILRELGASWSFIQKPFIFEGIFLSALGSVLALVGLSALAYLAPENLINSLPLPDALSELGILRLFVGFAAAFLVVGTFFGYLGSKVAIHFARGTQSA